MEVCVRACKCRGLKARRGGRGEWGGGEWSIVVEGGGMREGAGAACSFAMEDTFELCRCLRARRQQARRRAGAQACRRFLT
jgi:hypothetical protein